MDYESKPTKANASAFITRALEENWPAVQQSDGYMKYIATRPRAERLGDHGLFGDEDGVNLEQAMDELDHYTGNIWTHIISLKREDAARLGYDNARAWQNLLRANRNDIAAAMNISPGNFRWYAAYHDEGDHPHVHMMAWSTMPSEAYLTREGIHKIKSQLTNQIFRQEMLHTYEQKSQSRDELVWKARRAIRRLTREMAQSICSAPEIEQKMEQLAGQLEVVKGKKSYGYLPKSVKKTVDEVVDKLEELPVVQACYDQWYTLQNEVDSYYHDKPREKKKLSQEKEFRQIKNAVIQEAERIRLGEITFEDANLAGHDEAEQVRGESDACWKLRQIIRDESLSLADRDEVAEELERLAERGDTHAQYLMGQLYRHPGGNTGFDGSTVRPWQAAPLRRFGGAGPGRGHPLVETGGGKRKPFRRIPSGQRVSGGERRQQGRHKSSGLVHPVGGGRQPVRSIYAGQAVPHRTGRDSRPGSGDGLVQPFRRPGKPVCTILLGTPELPPSALRHAGGHPPALPHEPDL